MPRSVLISSRLFSRPWWTASPSTTPAAESSRPDPLPADQWPIQRVLRGETLKGPSSADMVARLSDGRLLALNISGTPIRDEQGHIADAVGIARDVTEQRRRDRRTLV